jgi:CMP-N,N'-diacetyllegionaminic acid synthase
MSFNKLKVFALVPARKNSTGLKGKNLFKVDGRRLIDFTLEAAIKSSNIDQIFVSSDSKKILDHALKFEKTSAILRPKRFSNNDSTAVEVVNHFLTSTLMLNQEEDFFIIYLQPTSPLRDENHIDQSFKLMNKKKKNTLIGVVENSFSPFKSFIVNKNDCVESLFDQSLSNLNRQDLPKTYRANGSIYTFRASDFLKINGFPSNNSVPFIMKEADSIDVDSPREIEQLEQELERRRKI